MKRKQYQDFWAPILLCLMIMGVSYRIVILHMMIPGTDFYYHAIDAIGIFQNGAFGVIKKFPYPIWHLGVKFFERVVHLNLFNSAAIMTALIYGVTYLIIFFFVKNNLQSRYSMKWFALLSMIVMVIQPISYQGITVGTDFGRPIFNTWHNPTNIVARMFGIVAFFLFVNIIDTSNQVITNKIKQYIAFSIALCLANLGKPTFSQIFIPTITIYCIIYCIVSKFSKFEVCLKIAISTIPSMIILGVQFWATLYEKGEGIEIAWFEVMNYSGKNNPLVILGTLAFPLFTSVAYFSDYIKDKKVVCAWIMYAISFLEFAAFAERGRRRYHGNFGWGYAIAVFVLQMVCIIKFMQIQKGNKWKKAIAIVILLCHIWCGCTYLYLQLSGIGLWY